MTTEQKLESALAIITESVNWGAKAHLPRNKSAEKRLAKLVSSLTGVDQRTALDEVSKRL